MLRLRVWDGMANYFALVTVFVSGVFALLVAFVTARLVERRESRAYQRDRERQLHADTKALYAETIAGLDRAIRATLGHEGVSKTVDEFPLLNARLLLTSPKPIIEQFEIVGDTLARWSAEYDRGKPMKIENWGVGVLSSEQFAHIDAAQKAYPKVHNEIAKLINLMKDHLDSLPGG